MAPRVAAVPSYVGESFTGAPPGHRFRLYFRVWNRRSWDMEKNLKHEALSDVVEPGPAVELARALHGRAAALAGDALVLDAVATAPFVTGMGMEHPLENGFAFLDPYGVPYLPGSSVKGVVRRAAEELALFEADSNGWTPAAVWWLFGFDANSGFFAGGSSDEPEAVTEERRRWKEAYRRWSGSFGAPSNGGTSGSADFSPQDSGGILEAYRRLVDPGGRLGKTPGTFLRALQDDVAARNSIHTRGSLAFWDVVPVPGKGEAAKLRVDIMNPHYGHYYQKGQPPHDAGDPKPIFYLTVPPGWSFTFVVRPHPVTGLPPWFTEEHHGRPRWQALLEAAFEHAFDWLGFGAKTALGYGAMGRDRAWSPPGREEVRLQPPPVREGRGHRAPATRHRRADSHRSKGDDPLESDIERLAPRDIAGLRALADRIAAVEDEARRRRLALALRERVGGFAGARAILNNHPVLGNYR